MAKSYDSYCVDSRKNGVKESAGKEVYPLHKTIATDKNAATKYGNSGFPSGKK